MKSGKDVGRENEKPMDPLFSRLHINDADKGGPRAAPMNKMALYDNLTVPSHRFGSSRPLASILRRSDAGFSSTGSPNQVQKFLAGSPALLVDEDLMTPLVKIASGEVIPDYNEFVPLEPTTKHEGGLPISGKATKCLTDNPEKPASSVNDIMSKGSGGQEPSHVRSDGTPSHGHITTDSRNTTRCFPPLGSQWLVPVMSPSEGLVYVPVAGPCSPTAGFLAPVYGACTPLSFPAVGGDIAKPAYGLLSSHHQGGVSILSNARSYFP